MFFFLLCQLISLFNLSCIQLSSGYWNISISPAHRKSGLPFIGYITRHVFSCASNFWGMMRRERNVMWERPRLAFFVCWISMYFYILCTLVAEPISWHPACKQDMPQTNQFGILNWERFLLALYSTLQQLYLLGEAVKLFEMRKKLYSNNQNGLTNKTSD
jgi:hypothetical protein